MLKRFLPHPHLSLTLLAVWLLLNNTLSLGHVLLGGVFGLVIPILTAAYWPDRPKIRNWLKVLEYGIVVIWDIILANIEVALIILFKPEKEIRSKWISVPLELTSPEAITVLAGTITMTPGTVSATLSADGQHILVHCLHSDEPDAVRDSIKERYERRLLEIFQ